jgi:dynein heavy chain, axonemal
MRASLKDVLRALAGEIGLSGLLEALSNSLFNGHLPAMWSRLNPETGKNLGSWMVWFHRRHQQYEDWADTGEPPVMWLSGLHIPETYIAALIQTACRQKGWPLDKSTLYTKVTKVVDVDEISEKPEFGCYVTGLYLEGAGWDVMNSVLKCQDPKVLITELPVMQIVPVEASKRKLAHTFRAPVYSTQNRTNAMGKGLIMEADVATNEHDSHWVLQGVALCLNISD